MHQSYIRRCLQLAELGRGYEQGNPTVGSVIVHDGRIIGEGWHRKYGGPHAEVNALASVAERHKHLLAESTIYVSLEPCFHYGKTPPCVDLILRHSIPKVVISCLDIHPKVAGQSVGKLRQQGVEVTVGVLEQEGMDLVRRFSTYHQRRRPYVILKCAQSEDGFLGRDGEQVWLTGALSKRMSHKWRAEEGAILVGTNTALVDNPQLTNRLYDGVPPLRVVLDRTHRIPESHHLLDGRHPTLYISENKRNIKGLTYFITEFNDALITQLLGKLWSMSIKSLIVEGGAKLLDTFIRAGIWDEARILTAPIRLGGGIPSPEWKGRVRERRRLGADLLEVFSNDGTIQ